VKYQMSIAEEYLDLVFIIAKAIEIPQITGIHLPVPVENIEKPDEFGFVFLQDGSVGPFFTSLDDTLSELWQLYPDGKNSTADTLSLIKHFGNESPALRSIALGAFNALSQHVMNRAGYSPVNSIEDNSFENNSVKDISTGINKPKAGEKVCMVGYFRPLIDKFLQQNIQILVLEKNPARVELQDGISLSTNPEDLSSCKHILCTASTLINGTLETILAASENAATFSLIGPSGSGLPDILFKHGVDAVGGIHFHDKIALQAALDKQESWGHAGSKYQITPDNYPGILPLLEKIRSAVS